MSIENEPIRNLEQAKRYFIAMGCSHFHLNRENFERRDEYYKLNISSDTEMKWRQEEVDKRFAEFPFNKPKKTGYYYSSLKDMIIVDNYHLERMLAIANDFHNILPPDQIHIVLSAIIGNNGSLTHGGLIEEACKIGLYDLSQRFVMCAKTFIEKAEDNDISIPWLRGYLIDVIKALGLNEKDAYLNILQERDYIENFKYYQQGAKEGNVFSMRMLARYYIEGKGCEVDRTLAIHWLTRAADSGNDLAKNELLELIKI